jgi:hypothetical protein
MRHPDGLGRLKNEKQVWIAWINTDLTEGRGHMIPYAICELKVTAVRIGKGKNTQGSDAIITSFNAIYDHGNGYWLAPCRIVPPTEDDNLIDKTRNMKEQAIKKAKELGLSDEDIMALGK